MNKSIDAHIAIENGLGQGGSREIDLCCTKQRSHNTKEKGPSHDEPF
ncbi:hypothetical protein [unidentified bacterial endosymbiont]|jgi:hypothetical protein|nr:hypothetical protein [unidentified bacterial endosymbiont]